MTTRHLVETDGETLAKAAFHNNVDIERDTATDRMYARIGNITLVAELPTEPCS